MLDDEQPQTDPPISSRLVWVPTRLTWAGEPEDGSWIEVPADTADQWDIRLWRAP